MEVLLGWEGFISRKALATMQPEANACRLMKFLNIDLNYELTKQSASFWRTDSRHSALHTLAMEHR